MACNSGSNSGSATTTAAQSASSTAVPTTTSDDMTAPSADCTGWTKVQCATEIDGTVYGESDIQWAEALAQCCIQLYPDYLPFQFQLGNLARKSGDLPAAAKRYAEVIAKTPVIGDRSVSDLSPDELMSHDAAWEAICAMGEIKSMRGDFFDRKEAEGWFRQAAELRKQDGRPLFGMAQLYLADQDYEKALALLEAALERNFNPGQTQILLARTLLDSDTQAPDPEKLKRAGDILLELRSRNRASTAVQRALIRYFEAMGQPREAAVAEMWAEYYSGEPNWNRILEIFQKNDLRTYDADVWNFYIFAISALGHNDVEIRDEYRKAIAAYPGEAELAVSFVGFLLKKGTVEEAEAELEKFIKLFPESSRLWIYKAAILQGKGDNDASLNAYLTAVQRNPYEATAMEEAAKFLRKLADTDEKYTGPSQALQAMLFYNKHQTDQAWTAFSMPNTDPGNLGLTKEYYTMKAAAAAELGMGKDVAIDALNNAMKHGASDYATVAAAVQLAASLGDKGTAAGYLSTYENTSPKPTTERIESIRALIE